MNGVLTVFLAVLVLGYTAYLIARMCRRGKGCGSCSGCPYAGKCGSRP